MLNWILDQKREFINLNFLVLIIIYDQIRGNEKGYMGILYIYFEP